MTEADWLASIDPEAMMVHLKGRASDRKLRLIVCACSRGVWPHLGEANQNAIDVAEGYADGLVKDRDRSAALKALKRQEPSPVYGSLTRTKDLHNIMRGSIWWIKLGLCGEAQEMATTIRDVIGDPLQPARLNPRLRRPMVLSLAEAAYGERELPSGHLSPARLAVLSDALEEAGCTEDAILSHLRSPGPHVRGCWALDLILGKV